MSYYYDRAGNPISMKELGDLLGRADYRRVARTEIGEADVSTVWLGIDHSFGLGGGPPIIFETMIFGGSRDEYQERYSTLFQAEAGHARIVEELRE